MKINYIKVVALLIIIAIGGILLNYYMNQESKEDEIGEYFSGYWGGIAKEIVNDNLTFRELASDGRLVCRIMEEGNYAYLYYDADDKTYNVSVDFKNKTVKSIEEVKDEKTLKLLQNSRRLTISTRNESGKFYTVDWNGMADEIVRNDSVIGNMSKIGGIAGEGTYAYLYYDADGKTYNVSVDFKNERVKSIEEVKDEKTLEFVNNSRRLIVSTSNYTPNLTSTNIHKIFRVIFSSGTTILAIYGPYVVA